MDDVARECGVSQATIYAWKAKYGGLDVSEAQRAATGDPLRQRPGADQPLLPGLGAGAEDRVATYPAGQANAERPCGELPRKTS